VKKKAPASYLYEANLSKRPKHEVGRNRKIYDAIVSGASYRRVAKEYQLSNTRVQQIVRDEQRRRLAAAVIADADKPQES
jgi:FixJ family two-component response regulator